MSLTQKLGKKGRFAKVSWYIRVYGHLYKANNKVCIVINEFIFRWQHLPEKMNPVILKIGWFQPRWYGLMYIIAFAVCYSLVVYRVKKENRFSIPAENIQDIMLYMIIGLIIGARLGYVLFYNFSYYLSHPLEIILPIQFSDKITFIGISGMSFHGGLMGIFAATFLYTHKTGVSYLEIADLFSPVAPLGYTFGRIGNFINGELYGRVTNASIGMFFPQAPGGNLRHPSQLYEAFFEGFILFIVLWNLRKHKWPKGSQLALYMFGYGFARFFIEYYRQPDPQLGFIWLSFSMGQILCGMMMVAAVILYLYLYRLDQR